MHRARWLALVCVAGCVRAPAPIDVDALVRAQGAVEARRSLIIRATEDRRDVASRLALAALDEKLGRPGDAIAALEQVEALGGPLGTRWRDEDRARLARLIAARGRARLARGAASAASEFARAARLGAAISDDEQAAARRAVALAEVRHSDRETREAGLRALAALADAPARRVATNAANAANVASTANVANPSNPASPATLAITDDDRAAWRGARAAATPAERGQLGAWLWAHGARRAAWDALSAWRVASPPPRDRALDDAFLVAARWWTPLDLPGPGELTGPLRCAFTACAPTEIVGENLFERAYLRGPVPPPVTDPAEVAAVVVITLHQALRGEAAWGAAVAARVDLDAFATPDKLAALPPFVQPLIARLVARDATVGGDAATPDHQLVLAAERVLAGAGASDVTALIGDAPYAEELRRIATPPAPFTGDARAEAAVRHASLAVPRALAPATLRAIIAAYRRDPAIADRLAREAAVSAPDAAIIHAATGALFDALGDPARARAAWQAAVDMSAEPAFLRGLAEAQARHGDGDAALVTATAAAAAHGDPAVVWISVARGLVSVGRYVHALDAARSAIDLAGPDDWVAAFDVAIAASEALNRAEQVASLAAQRAKVAPGRSVDATGSSTLRDPTDARSALAAYRAQPSADTIARLWTAARWNPRDVEARAALLRALAVDDARRGVVIGELVELAGSADPDVRRAAVAALSAQLRS